MRAVIGICPSEWPAPGSTGARCPRLHAAPPCAAAGPHTERQGAGTHSCCCPTAGPRTHCCTGCTHRSRSRSAGRGRRCTCCRRSRLQGAARRGGAQGGARGPALTGSLRHPRAVLRCAAAVPAAAPDPDPHTAAGCMHSQLASSLCRSTQAPLQSVWPVGHTRVHTPAWHCSPAFVSQAVPQVPPA